jgi:hypothetical protein
VANVGFAEPAGPIWDFLLRLSYLGFVAATAVAIVIVYYSLWRWIRGRAPLGD